MQPGVGEILVPDAADVDRVGQEAMQLAAGEAATTSRRL
jgi:hypothetical protein